MVLWFNHEGLLSAHVCSMQYIHLISRACVSIHNIMKDDVSFAKVYYSDEKWVHVFVNYCKNSGYRVQ